MRYNFKIGDTVKLNPEEYNECYDEMPNWNISNSYKIVEISDEKDCDGVPIVMLNKSFYHHRDDSTTISTQFLLPDIKKQRKLKLQKIYESRG
jgi:hypothetical protein